MTKFFAYLYRKIYDVPLLMLALVGLLTVFAGFGLRGFTFDASTDTLVEEGDPALAEYQEVTETFGSDEFLILTYDPLDDPLISEPTIAKLENLERRLLDLPGLSNVTSVLDAPLLKSPPITLSEWRDDYNTLRKPEADLALAADELRESPVYRDLLISSDGDVTAMSIDLEPGTEMLALWEERNRLRALETRSPEEARALSEAQTAYLDARRDHIEKRAALMNELRLLREDLSDEAVVNLSGVPIIASDIIAYIKDDVSTFGGMTVLLVMVGLFVFFRELRWVILPILTAILSVFITSGLLGFGGQAVTLISSNYISLLIIFSIAISVHLVVRYRELAVGPGNYSHRELILTSLGDKFAPCFYTALTTIVAFASLMASNVLPVSDFGLIMCFAMVIAFVMNFTFFPALLFFFPGPKKASTNSRAPFFTMLLGNISLKSPGVVLIAVLVGGIISAVGIYRLSWESQLIDYFKDNSEVRKGIVYIDERFGGTTSMDIVLNFQPYEAPDLAEEDDFFVETADDYPERYWYTADKISALRKLHTFLESRPEVGKIISLATFEEQAREFNDGQGLDTLQLAAVVGVLSEQVRDEFLLPYASPSQGQLRVNLRIRETGPAFSRADLITETEAFLIEEMGFAPEEVKVTGLNVLFNNMLEGLVRSQVSTIGYVVLATFIMFLVLLRSVRLAVIGLIPNVFSAAIILGVMGYLGIVLDMLTITIAAIIVGIGVDNAIHYLHRIKVELAVGRNIGQAIHAAHRNVGFALYVTCISIVAGFSVLVFSNFVPAIYFGLLTALAMIVTLCMNLLVLPSLLMLTNSSAPALPQTQKAG